METDSNGEVKVVWQTELPGARGSISIYDVNWESVKEERTPELWTVNAKRLPRETIVGKIDLPSGVTSGIKMLEIE